MTGEQLTIDDALARYPDGPGFKADGTSKEAAEKVSGGTEAARGRILSLLWQSQPMTADEIAAHFDWSPFYARPRVSELHKLNAIKKAGRRRNASGLNANTWTVA
jgi:predicted ArsR family transcriptional regulator